MSDGIKLVKVRDPEPSTHFDERMNLKLRDLALPPRVIPANAVADFVTGIEWDGRKRYG